MYFNQLATKSLLLIGLTLGMVGCSRAPDPQDDIPLFKTFIAENIDKVSDDPYISSTVKPGDKMYEFLKYLQHGSGRNRLIKALVDDGDPEAMLWFARLNLGNTEIRGQVLQLMRDSMLAGNPYAALELSEGSESCTYYFGRDSVGSELAEMAGLDSPDDSDVCSKDNFTKAVKGFEKLAAEGDLRAQYFLLKQKHWDKSKETRADYIHEIIRFAKAHYYQPLMDYVSTILYRPEKDYISDTPEQRALAIELLTIASNNNYIPAIERLIRIDKEKGKDNIMYLKLLNLGSPYYYASRFLRFENEYDKNELYCFATAYQVISGGDRKLFIWLDDSIEKSSPSCNQKKTSAMVYIDGFTKRDFWRDRGGR
ncbi:sel1 repeat family protein [Vibrio owensii]|uniref:sel1 repeat family protein n=1 Tax=Vibrio owensii TaxID=696485 RepID=UPI003CE48B00